MTRSLLAALMVSIAGPARGQEAASFLRIGSGARAQALGGAYTALAADANALSWNPAGLARLDRPEAAATHALYLGDHYDSLSLAVPLGNWSGWRRRSFSGPAGRVTGEAVYPSEGSRGVLAVGFSRLGGATQEGRSVDRTRTGNFSTSDWALSLGYARPVAGPLSAGLAIKRVQSRVADASGGAFAADAGLALAWTGLWSPRLGASARNLGSDLRLGTQAWPLPLTFAFGAAVEPTRGLTFAAEAQRRPKAGRTVLSFGTEYRVHPLVSLRAGLLNEGSRAPAWSRSLSGGFGLHWDRLSLDYAFSPFGSLGNVQTLSVKGRF